MLRTSAWTVALIFGGLVVGCGSSPPEEILVVPGAVPECGDPEVLVLGWQDTLRTDFGSGQVTRSEVPLVDFAGVSVDARWVDANTEDCPPEQDMGCLAVSLPVQRAVGTSDLVLRSRDGSVTRTKAVEVQAAPPTLRWQQRPPGAGQAPVIRVQASCPVDGTALVTAGTTQVQVELEGGESLDVELPATACGPVSIELADSPGAVDAVPATLIGQPLAINVVRFGAAPLQCERAFSVILQDACAEDLPDIAWRPVITGMGILGAGDPLCQPFSAEGSGVIEISVEPEDNVGKFNVKVSARTNPEDEATEYAATVVTYGGDGPAFRFEPALHTADNYQDCVDGWVVFLDANGREAPLQLPVTIETIPPMTIEPMCPAAPGAPIALVAGIDRVQLYGRGRGATDFTVRVLDSQGTTEKLWPISYAMVADPAPVFTTQTVNAGCSPVELKMSEPLATYEVQTRFGLPNESHGLGDGLFMDDRCIEPVTATVRVQDRKTLYMFHRLAESQLIGARVGATAWHDTVVTVQAGPPLLVFQGPDEVAPGSTCVSYNVIVADAFGNPAPEATAQNETFTVAVTRRDNRRMSMVQVSANCATTPLGAPIDLAPTPGPRSFAVWPSSESGFFVLGAGSQQSALVGRHRLRIVPTCGNGVIDAGEACDTGDLETSSGCNNCAVEGGFLCYGAPSRCADTEDVTFVAPAAGCPSDANCSPSLETAINTGGENCSIFVTESLRLTRPLAPPPCDNNGGRVSVTVASGVIISGTGPLLRPDTDSRLEIIGGIWNSDTGGAATIELVDNARLIMTDAVVSGRADVGINATATSRVTLQESRIFRHAQAGLRSVFSSVIDMRNVIVQGRSRTEGVGLDLKSTIPGTFEHVTVFSYATALYCQNAQIVLASALESNAVVPAACVPIESCSGDDLRLDPIGRLRAVSPCIDSVAAGTTMVQRDFQLQPRPMMDSAATAQPFDAGADEYW